MKIAYLVVAHNNPRHLLRLIRTLSSDASSFFVHVDRKSNLDDFATIRGENVHVAGKRIPVYWGDFSLIEAILVLLRTGLADRRRFDYFVLLSGSDYPLRSASYIESYFERSAGGEFMNIVPMPCEAMGKPLSRITAYTVRPGDIVSKTPGFVRNLLIKTGAVPTERDYGTFLRGLVPYGGSTWWALSRESCEYIRNFVDREIRVVNFFKNTFIPDESMFQTILGNSPFKARILRNLTYADWSAGGPNPAWIAERHLAFLQSGPPVVLEDGYGKGEALFARKFSDQAGDVVAQLDRLAGNREERKPGHGG